MTDEQLLAQGIRECERICAASRDFRETSWPQVENDYVAFYPGDRRFHIYEATTLYVELYLSEEAGNLSLDAALADENHVRELIEVITS